MFQDIAATSHVVVNAYYIRKKCNNKNITLAQLIDEKKDGDFYSILDKGFGDDIKTFEIKTEDLLGKDFQSVKNFIIKVESIAYRFVSQVMANNKKS